MVEDADGHTRIFCLDIFLEKFMKRKQSLRTPKKVTAKKGATKAKTPIRRKPSLHPKQSPVLAFNYRDASRLSGIRTATLRQWLLEEKIVRGEDGSFNVTELMELRSKENPSLKSGVSRSPKAQKAYDDYWSAKAEEKIMDLKIKKGALLDSTEVLEELVARELIFKNRLLGLPSLFASQLVGCTAKEIQEIVRKTLFDILRELVRQGSEAYAKRQAEAL